MAIKTFDVFVIGSGIAGQTVAKECADSGLKVAITDHREFGGTCANRGCDPKKVLLGFTEIIKSCELLQGNGISKIPEYDWDAMMRFKESFTKAIPYNTEKDLVNRGITLYHQSPEFLDTGELSVEGKTMITKNIVIATGLMPRTLSFEGATLLSNSDDFLNLSKLPKSIVFIGAGYIGMEFAFIAARLGTQVTIIDRGARPLKNFDQDMVLYLMEEMSKLKITFIGNAEIDSVKALRKNKRVCFKVSGQEKSVKARLIFNTTGRVPSVANLALHKAKVSYDNTGIKVNEYLQSVSNQKVYACGDIAAHALPLTPFSGVQGAIVAQNILHGNKKKVQNHVTPTTVFTLPNLASVGVSENAAKKECKSLEIIKKDGAEWYNAKRVNEKIYASKVLIDLDNDLIIGAHLVGPEAGEVINLFTLAIQNKIKVSEIKNTIFAYPTWSADIKNML